MGPAGRSRRQRPAHHHLRLEPPKGHHDHLCTPQRITDKSGAVIWAADYDAYGKAIIRTTADATKAITSNLRYPGQYWDAETGLHHNDRRYYDPDTGRYLSSDPIGFEGGINLYAYAAAAPGRYTDPTGEMGMDDVWGGLYRVTGGWSPSQGVVDFSAGFGDTLSFGGSGVVRSWMGTDGAVNRCSSAYSNGEWGAIALSLAFGGAHLGRNALNQMGRAGDLGTRVRRGVGRVFSDGRRWGSVRNTWSVAAGNGKRWLAENGQSLHHWLIPQRFAKVNAGFNYMPISAGFNSWMNGSTAFRTAVEWGFRGSVLGIYGAPLTAPVSGDDCTCQK